MKFVRMQHEVQRRAAQMNLDPRELLLEGMAAARNAHLTPEQLARYQVEIESRSEFKKEVAVRNLIVKLDGVLWLTTEQRERLRESLSSHWNREWCPSLQVFRYEQYIPDIPDEYLVPFLSSSQKEAWQGLQKTASSTIGISFGSYLIVNNALLDDEEVSKPHEGPAPPRPVH